MYDAKKVVFAFSYAIIGAMRSSLRICVGVVVLLALADGLAAQAGPSIPRGVMDGIVTDTSLAPIAGATISLLGSPVSAKSGENGRFRIVALPAGEYVVLARRLGYASASATLHVDGGDTLRPSFALRRVTPELDTVRASALFAVSRLGEFEERRAQAVGGHFITANEIYKRNPVHIADMLQSVLSVSIVADRIGRRKAFTTRDTPGRPPCPFQIFVDGQVFDESGDLSNAPPPGNVAGIEIYSGPATIPLEYKRLDTMCGIILIWTKSGE